MPFLQTDVDSLQGLRILKQVNKFAIHKFTNHKMYRPNFRNHLAGRSGGGRNVPYAKPSGLLQYETVEWGKNTYMLPQVAQNNDPIATKQQVLDETARQIKDGSGKWNSKVNLIVLRFGLPIAQTKAEQEAAPLKSYTSAVYHHSNVVISRANGQRQNVTDPLTANQQQQAFYLFDVRFGGYSGCHWKSRPHTTVTLPSYPNHPPGTRSDNNSDRD